MKSRIPPPPAAAAAAAGLAWGHSQVWPPWGPSRASFDDPQVPCRCLAMGMLPLCPTKTLPRLLGWNGRHKEPFPEVKWDQWPSRLAGRWHRCGRRPAGRRELRPHCQRCWGWMVSTAGASSPPPAGVREAGQAGRPLCLPEVTRGHRPTAALLRVLPQLRDKPDIQQRIQPRFCCFFPQSWVEAARGQGPRSLLSAKPTGARRGDSGVLPALPRARAPWGKRGRRCLPCGKEGGTISDRNNLPSSFTSH